MACAGQLEKDIWGARAAVRVSPHPRASGTPPHLPLELLDLSLGHGVFDLELQESRGGHGVGTAPRAGTPCPPPAPPHLLELVHQLLGVHLHGGQRVLVLGQLEHLDGHLPAGEHGAHLLLLVRGVFPGLRRARGGVGIWGCCPWPRVPSRVALSPHLLVILGVLGVALLHHLPLPPLLLQRLLDQLRHLALLPRLLPPDQEPGGHRGSGGTGGTQGHSRGTSLQFSRGRWV